jgi:hypothetical protein
MMDRPEWGTRADWVDYADWLEAEREEASQDYADLLKDHRKLKTKIVNQQAALRRIADGIHYISAQSVAKNALGANHE